MKQITVLLLSFLLSLCTKSQSIQVFTENKPDGFILFAKNTEIYPVSISFNLILKNMVFSEGEKMIFILPAKAEKFKIGEITSEPSKKTSFRYTYQLAMGDVNAKPDKGYIYDLPFQRGKVFKLFQGYNGTVSHKNENSLDFTMPEGTEVLSARDGIVVQVIQNFSENCWSEECKKKNNYITIMHNDGTFAEYLHIKYNGAKVKAGDAVKKGDLIAYSGNVGYSSGPHLHFDCYQPAFNNRITLETKFRTGDGSKVASLIEGQLYTRTY